MRPYDACRILFLAGALAPALNSNALVFASEELIEQSFENSGDDNGPLSVLDRDSDEAPLHTRFLRGLKNKNKNYGYNNYSGYNNGYNNGYNGGNNYNNNYNKYNNNNNNNNNNYSNNNNNYNGYNNGGNGGNNYNNNNSNSYNSYGNNGYNTNSLQGATPSTTSSSNNSNGSAGLESGGKYLLGFLALVGVGYAATKIEMNTDQEEPKKKKSSSRRNMDFEEDDDEEFGDGGGDYMNMDGESEFGLEMAQPKRSKNQKSKSGRRMKAQTFETDATSFDVSDASSHDGDDSKILDEKEALRNMIEMYKGNIAKLRRGQSSKRLGSQRGMSKSNRNSSSRNMITSSPEKSTSSPRTRMRSLTPQRASSKRLQGKSKSGLNLGAGPLTVEDFNVLQSEKQLLRQMLGAYEKEFLRIYNRPIGRPEDVEPAAEQYRRYKEVKKILASHKMQQQHHEELQQQLQHGDPAEFGFSSSRWDKF